MQSKYLVYPMEIGIMQQNKKSIEQKIATLICAHLRTPQTVQAIQSLIYVHANVVAVNE